MGIASQILWAASPVHSTFYSLYKEKQKVLLINVYRDVIERHWKELKNSRPWVYMWSHHDLPVYAQSIMQERRGANLMSADGRNTNGCLRQLRLRFHFRWQQTFKSAQTFMHLLWLCLFSFFLLFLNFPSSPFQVTCLKQCCPYAPAAGKTADYSLKAHSCLLYYLCVHFFFYNKN